MSKIMTAAQVNQKHKDYGAKISDIVHSHESLRAKLDIAVMSLTNIATNTDGEEFITAGVSVPIGFSTFERQQECAKEALALIGYQVGKPEGNTSD